MNKNEIFKITKKKLSVGTKRSEDYGFLQHKEHQTCTYFLNKYQKRNHKIFQNFYKNQLSN
jgi:hypothetical protein